MKIVITITPAFIAAVATLIAGLMGRKLIAAEKPEAKE
jgi:hypothetical protein